MSISLRKIRTPLCIGLAATLLLIAAGLSMNLPELLRGTNAQVVLPLDAKGVDAPRFPWGPFARFWNTNCLKGMEIKTTIDSNKGKLVTFGDNVGMIVHMQGGVVSGISAHYTGTKNTVEGGRTWLRLLESIITFGSYRWPPSKVQELRNAFFPPSTQAADFVWATSRFQRHFNQDTGWTFRLDLVPIGR